MPIYTRTGDKGKTSLANGQRVSKTDCLVEVFGDLDEFNSLLGVCLNYAKTPQVKVIFPFLQDRVFNLGSHIAGAKKGTFREITKMDVFKLEKEIDRVESKLPKLRNFIIPGGSLSGAFIHLARTVCRRVERHLVKGVFPSKKYDPVVYAFINRTSDLLFVLARLENKNAQITEKYWNLAKINKNP